MKSLWIIFAPVLAMVGCRAPVNRSFDISMKDAQRELKRMADDPVTLDRPVVVLAGWQDPGVGAASVAAKLRAATGDRRIIAVSFPVNLTFEACRVKTMRHIAKAFGDHVQVDVVGISMGGIVARYAAMAEHDPPLRIARLFTLSTPHRGALMAIVPFPDPRAADMKRGSPFMQRIEQARRDYPIIPYVRLHDAMVGAANAAPPGQTPWWVSPPLLQPSHLWSFTDARLLTDIARRLRGQVSITRLPPAELPSQ